MDELKNFVTAQFLQYHWKILPAELLDFIHSGLSAYRQTGILIEAAELLPEKTLIDIKKKLALRAAIDLQTRKDRSVISLGKIPSSFRRPPPPTATIKTLSDIDTEANQIFENLRKQKDNKTLTCLNTFLFKHEGVNKFAQLHGLNIIAEAKECSTSVEVSDIIGANLTKAPDKHKASSQAATSKKKRSRSSDDRELSIILAKQFIDQHQTKKKTYTLLEAVAYIRPKLTKTWPPRTIKGWITLYFTDEAKKPGRPKTKKVK